MLINNNYLNYSLHADVLDERLNLNGMELFKIIVRSVVLYGSESL